jgi:hypothetical protein
MQAGDKAKEERIRAIGKMVRLEDESVADAALLCISASSIRDSSQQSLDFLPEIGAACKHESPRVRKAALLTLGCDKAQVSTKRDPVPLLIAGLEDSDESVRNAALTATIRLLRWGGLLSVESSAKLVVPLASGIQRAQAKQVIWGVVAMESLAKGSFQTPGDPPRDEDGHLLTHEDSWWGLNLDRVKDAVARYAKGVEESQKTSEGVKKPDSAL